MARDAERRDCVLTFNLPACSPPRGNFSGGPGGGGHGVVGGEEPGPGSAVAAGVTGRVSPERPEEKPRPLSSPAAISRMGLGVDAGALPA